MCCEVLIEREAFEQRVDGGGLLEPGDRAEGIAFGVVGWDREICFEPGAVFPVVGFFLSGDAFVADEVPDGDEDAVGFSGVGADRLRTEAEDHGAPDFSGLQVLAALVFVAFTTLVDAADQDEARP